MKTTSLIYAALDFFPVFTASLTLKDKKARSRATWAKAGRRCKGGNKSGRAKVENRGFWTFASES